MEDNEQYHRSDGKVLNKTYTDDPIFSEEERKLLARALFDFCPRTELLYVIGPVIDKLQIRVEWEGIIQRYKEQVG
jgi:hypothetical protein